MKTSELRVTGLHNAANALGCIGALPGHRSAV